MRSGKVLTTVVVVLACALGSGCGGGGDGGVSEPPTAQEQAAQDLARYGALLSQASSRLDDTRTLAQDGACTASSDCDTLKFEALTKQCLISTRLVYSKISENASNIRAGFDDYKSLSAQALALEPTPDPGMHVSCVSSLLEFPASCVAQVCQ